MRTSPRRSLRSWIATVTTVATFAFLAVPMMATPAAAYPSLNDYPELSSDYAIVGEEITATDGEWSSTIDLGEDDVAIIERSWQACVFETGTDCEWVEQDGDNAYTPTIDDLGKFLRFYVVAEDAQGTQWEYSINMAPVYGPPVNDTRPAISGDLNVGAELTTTNGEWLGTDEELFPMTFHYQWQACNSSGLACANLGTDSSSYTLTGSEEGKRIRVTVTAINDFGSASRQSLLSAEVGPADGAPVNTVQPVISGVLADGNTLTTTDGTWTGETPMTFEYEWYLCPPTDPTDCHQNEDAHASEYELTSDDIGWQIKVRVYATNDDGTEYAESELTATIGAIAPVNSVLPVIDGVYVRGEEIAATTGTWSGSQPIEYSYQWTRCNAAGGNCTDIDGEDGSGDSYELDVDDVGSRLRVRVTALNEGGTAAAVSLATPVVTASVPGDPDQPAVTRGNGEIEVSFNEEVADGGAEITGFTAACSSADGGTPGSKSGASSPLTVTGLDNGKTYTCVVYATNEIGDGLESQASDEVVPATVPGKPAAPVVERGNGQISVDWDEPADIGGAAITGYRVECTDTETILSKTTDAETTAAFVTGASNGTPYTCKVRATNEVGDGLYSDASDEVIPATTPDAPGKPTITPIKNGFSVSFTEPESDGGVEIESYLAECSSSDGGSPGSSDSSGSPIEITSLTEGKTYTCTVTATNDVGDSAPSTASDAATVPTVPGAPTSVSASVQADGSASVSFSEPGNSGGLEVTSFTVECTSSDGGNAAEETGESSPIVVTGLTYGKTYTCIVFATNEIGDSEDSSASASFVPKTVPAAPTGVTAVRSGTEGGVLSVDWTGPDYTLAANNGGSAVIGYTAKCTSSDGGVFAQRSQGVKPILVSPTTDGKTYTCKVHATNAQGDSVDSDASASVVSASVPDAPTNVSASRNGSASVSVSFTAPADDGGSAITGYTATCGPSSESGATSPITVGELSNGSPVTCTVKATNAVGNSVASDPSESVTPATVPGKPAAPTIANGGATSQVVTFSAPDNDGGATITGYTASCESSNGGMSNTNTGSSSPITVTGLSKNKAYTCKVKATNEVGDGDYSDASNSDSTDATAPGAPTNVSASRNGSGSLSVSFTAPEDDGGQEIESYTAICGEQSNTGASSPITVSGLANGTPVTCTVSATNDTDTGAPSAPSDSVTPATTPSAPTIGAVTRSTTTSGAVDVAFTENSDGGSAKTNITATCTSSDDGAASPKSNNGFSSPIFVSGLTKGATYTCNVKVTNEVGTGPASEESDEIVPAWKPEAPTVSGITVGKNQVSVAFTANDDNGAEITSFTATCNPAGDEGEIRSNDGNASPIVVSGLTTGVTYDCVVTATNEVGESDASFPHSDLFWAESVPDAMEKPTVTPGDSKIRVSFTAPNFNFSLITGYTATCYDDNEDDFSETGDANATYIDVGGLINGDDYTCDVYATNAHGDGERSPLSDEVSPDVVPGAPEIDAIDHTGAGDNSVKVTFSPPETNNGTAVTGYTVTCTSSEGGTTQTNSDEASPITVTGLTNGKSYTCTVHATNGAGNSLESTASSSFVAAAKPDAPTNVSAERSGTSGGALSVSFTPGAANGAEVTDYDVDCTSTDGGSPGGDDGDSSPIVVTGLTNGKTYTCTVTAENSHGESSPSEPSDSVFVAGVPSKPDAPGVEVNEEDGRAIDVSVDAPADNGAPIVEYLATCTNGDDITESGTSSTPTVTVDGLDKGQEYTCQIKAISDIGESLTSEPSDPIELPATVPDKPAKPTVEHNGENTLLVTWVAPYDGGSDIIGFGVNCTSSDGGVQKSVTALADATSKDVTGVDNGKHYTCTVLATNLIGDSESSDPSDDIVPQSKPGTPTIGVAERIDPNSVKVSFTPADDLGGATEVTTSAVCTSSDGGTTRSGSGSSPITVENLTNGKTYTCTVHHTNDAGNGEQSAATSSFTAASKPSAPAISKVTRGNGSVEVEITPGAANGASITSYDVECASSNGGTSGEGDDESTTVTLSGLTNGKTYTCTATATNTLGTSAASDASDSFVPATVPGAPDNLELTGGNAQISVAFDPPASDGGSEITSYRVTCESEDDGAESGEASGEASPIVVDGLTNGATYGCAVYATNAVGEGPSSASDDEATPSTVPGKPAITGVERSGGTSIIVSFTAPDDDGGSTITGYTAECTSSNGGEAGDETGEESPITVAGLTAGKTYTCIVFATNKKGDGPDSDASDEVETGAAPANTVAPVISGTMIVGRTITVTNGTWTGTPAPTFTRQWRRCNNVGASCVDIDGATGTSYKLTNDDIDMKLRVVVTASNVVDDVDETSAATTKIKPIPHAVMNGWYYDGKDVKKQPGAVGAAVHGATVWTVNASGKLLSGTNYGQINKPLNKPIIGIAAASDGKGYWMVASDGGVFAFGSAKFKGSLGNKKLNKPIVGMAAMPDRNGYFLFAADGGVFTFGSAKFKGSAANAGVSNVRAMLVTQSGNGYILVTTDGRSFSYGDASKIGRVTGRNDIIGLVITNAGFRMVTKNYQLLTPH